MNAIQPYHSRSRSISLTALVDVVFILLLFFMLSSTFEQWRAVDFHSPVANANLQSDHPDPQILVLGETGSLRLHGNDFSVDHYAALTAWDVARFDAERPLVLLSEAYANVQTIVSSVERLKAIGLEPVLGGALPVEDE